MGIMTARIVEKEVPVKSYKKRQEEWIKENNVKIGTRVKVVRENTEPHMCSNNKPKTARYIGEEAKIVEIFSDMLGIGKGLCVPYTMLEVIPESIFKPFKLEIDVDNEDQLKDLYHRFFLGIADINAISCAIGISKTTEDIGSGIFNLLIDRVEKLVGRE